jgi:hypothetical protein
MPDSSHNIDLWNGGSTYTCLCGRSFSQSSALAYHKRSCKRSKRRFNGALEKAKEVWEARKRRRVEATERRNSSQSETTGGGHMPAAGGDRTTDSEADDVATIEV